MYYYYNLLSLIYLIRYCCGRNLQRSIPKIGEIISKFPKHADTDETYRN